MREIPYGRFTMIALPFVIPKRVGIATKESKLVLEPYSPPQDS
jgi:hypothetical protein